LDSETDVSSNNPQSQQTFLLATTKCPRFTTTVSEFSNGTVSATPWHPLPALPWAAKPQKYLFDPLLSLRSQCSVNIALFDSFSLCLRLFPVLGPAVVSESDIRREPEASGGDQCGRGNAQARWLQLGLQLHRCSSC